MHLLLTILSGTAVLVALGLNFYDLKLRSKRIINEKGEFDELSISGYMMPDDIDFENQQMQDERDA
jgi:hypothetical protein